MEDEVEFLQPDKQDSFLQIDSITLGMPSQACPNYPKQQVYNISAIITLSKHDGIYTAFL